MARNVALAERQAEVAEMAAEEHTHRALCRDCKPRQPCRYLVDLRSELAAARQEVASWFAPGPGQGTLWGEDEAQ